MTTSRRLSERKVAKFEKNITKRSGAVHENSSTRYPVGPVLLGFFVFVVIGSCAALFQIYSDCCEWWDGLRMGDYPLFVTSTVKDKSKV